MDLAPVAVSISVGLTGVLAQVTPDSDAMGKITNVGVTTVLTGIVVWLLTKYIPNRDASAKAERDEMAVRHAAEKDAADKRHREERLEVILKMGDVQNRCGVQSEKLCDRIEAAFANYQEHTQRRGTDQDNRITRLENHMSETEQLLHSRSNFVPETALTQEKKA